MDFFKLAPVILLFPLVNHAAEKISLTQISFSALKQKMTFSLSKPQSMGIRPEDDLVFLSEHIDEQQIKHTRMQQWYAGFPVVGGYAIFHQSQVSKNLMPHVTMHGVIYEKLKEDLGQVPRDFIANVAPVLKKLRSHLNAAFITSEQAVPLIYIDDHQHAFWAYQIGFMLEPHESMPSRPTFIIDAKTHSILNQWDDLNTLHLVQGQGYGGNPRMGKHQYGKELPFLSLLRDEHTGRCTLANRDVMVVDMAHQTMTPNIPYSFNCEEDAPDDLYWTGPESDGYDEINGCYSVSNDAMYAGELIQKMYKNEYGMDVLRSGKGPMRLILRVHYSHRYGNAFWDGRQMTFGDGDEFTYPLVSLGIAAHEISHGFTEQHSGLVYRGQSGALNEAFSDMAAQAAEYFVYGKASWQIGGEIVKGKGALRFLNHPHRDGLSIERADHYQIGMDVHHSSGVYNYLYYLLANRPDWNPKKAFEVMIKANRDYWTPTTNFEEAACGILTASKDLGYGVEDVIEALETVHIDYDDCEEHLRSVNQT